MTARQLSSLRHRGTRTWFCLSCRFGGRRPFTCWLRAHLVRSEGRCWAVVVRQAAPVLSGLGLAGRESTAALRAVGILSRLGEASGTSAAGWQSAWRSRCGTGSGGSHQADAPGVLPRAPQRYFSRPRGALCEWVNDQSIRLELFLFLLIAKTNKTQFYHKPVFSWAKGVGGVGLGLRQD